jgi:hypothetical protein
MPEKLIAAGAARPPRGGFEEHLATVRACWGPNRAHPSPLFRFRAPKSARSRSIARSTCRFARPNPPDCVIVVQGDIGTRFGERPSLAGGLSDRVTPHYEPATHTGPVALHRARRGALVRAGADHLGRIGVDQRLKHQLHRTTNKSRSPTTADRVRQVDTLRVRESHRVFSFAC